MVKVVWAGVEREVKCSAEELAEALAMDCPVMFGSWLGDVEAVGHDAAMMIARDEYGS
jgi:hypothetical protein